MGLSLGQEESFKEAFSALMDLWFAGCITRGVPHPLPAPKTACAASAPQTHSQGLNKALLMQISLEFVLNLHPRGRLRRAREECGDLLICLSL